MKKRICVILCAMGCLLLAGCSKDKNASTIQLFYLNPEGNALVQREYSLVEENDLELATVEILDVLQKPEDVKDVQSPIPPTITVEEVHLNGERLEISFNGEYKVLNKGSEVLLRASVVQTVVQVPGVTYVSFYVEGKPLEDSKGNLIGAMSAEDFLQNTGTSLKSYQERDLQLYFANKDGTKLVKENRAGVRYNANTSIEKLVVEQLMKGASTDKKSSTIPNTVKLLGVSVREGTCYVNFNSAFLEDGYNQKPEVAIYSIVNSIIANGNATKVQILIDGANVKSYKGALEMSEPLEWKADLIEE